MKFLQDRSFSLSESKFETLSFFLAPLFIVFTLVEVGIQYRFTPVTMVSGRILQDFIFLSAIHVVFTALLFLKLDQFKDYFEEVSGQKRLGLFWQWVLIYLVFIFLAFILVNLSLSSTFFWEYSAIKAATLYRLYHGASQSTGIALIHYAQFDKQFSSVKAKIFLIERMILYTVAIFSALCFLIIFFGAQILQLITFFIFLALVIGLFTWLFIVVRKVGSPNFLKLKMLYSLRYLLYPLTFVSQSATIGVSAVHGIEYYFIYKKLTQDSQTLIFKKNFQIASWVLAATILYFISYGIVLLSEFENFKNNESLKVVYLMAFCFFTSINFLHYYVDGRIFRFKNPAVQKNIAPLFFNSKKNV